MDILLAATLASWATVMVPVAIGGVVTVVLNFSVEALYGAVGLVAIWAGASFFIAVFACTILGLPALGIAKLFKLDAWWHAAIIGAFAGLAFVVTISGGRIAFENLNDIASAATLIVAGIVAGIAAWRERRKGAQSM